MSEHLPMDDRLICAECRYGRVNPPVPGYHRVCRHPVAIAMRDPIDGYLPACIEMRRAGSACGIGARLWEPVPIKLRRKSLLQRAWLALTGRA